MLAGDFGCGNVCSPRARRAQGGELAKGGDNELVCHSCQDQHTAALDYPAELKTPKARPHTDLGRIRQTDLLLFRFALLSCRSYGGTPLTSRSAS